MSVTDLKYHELTKKTIGCAVKVHRYSGIGFPEIVYKRAVLAELRKQGISCREEVEKEIIYDGKVIYKRRPGLLIKTGLLLKFGTPGLF